MMPIASFNIRISNKMEGDGFLKQSPGFATKAIHVGQEPEKWQSSCVVPPIINSTTFKQTAPGKHEGYVYGRSGNPTRNVLDECIATLDDGKYGFCFASGLGATTAITSLLTTGDHLLSTDDICGGASGLFRQVLPRLGIEITYVDFTDLRKLENAIQPNTKMIWIESPSNPLLKIIDIAGTVNLTKKHNKEIIVVCDNTFLTSYLQRPLHFGADIVLYSLTKYMNGHSDVIMGAVVCNDDDLATRIRFLQNALGIIPSPFDCYQINRSLKTLSLRMERHKSSSLELARWLEAHPNVVKVLHPGLPSHPQHDLAMKQMYGHSGMISFYHEGGLNESNTFLTGLKVFTLAESLGGYESLAELPSVMTHISVPAELRKELGITDALVRLSVGLEDPEDLIKDIQQALSAAFPIVLLKCSN